MSKQIVCCTITLVLACSAVDAQLEIQQIAKFANPNPEFRRTGGREVEFSEDGTKIIAAFYGSTIQLFDLKDNTAICESIRTSGDGEVGFVNDEIAYSSDWNSMQLWNAQSGEPLGNAIPHELREDTIIQPAISPQGKLIATRTTMKSVQLWDVATQKPIGKPREYSDVVSSIRFTADGRRLMVRSGKSLYALSCETGEVEAGPFQSGWQFYHFAKQQKLVTTEQKGDELPQLVIRSTDKKGWPETHRSKLPGRLKRIIALDGDQVLMQATKDKFLPAMYLMSLERPSRRIEVETDADRAFGVAVTEDKQHWVCTNIRSFVCQKFGQSEPVWKKGVPPSGYDLKIFPFNNEYFIMIDKEANFSFYAYSDGSEVWHCADVNRFSKYKNRIAFCTGDGVEVWELK
ncbi:MAG: hypothetical protein AAFN77_09205 [Planctomycetota bacterium]